MIKKKFKKILIYLIKPLLLIINSKYKPKGIFRKTYDANQIEEKQKVCIYKIFDSEVLFDKLTDEMNKSLPKFYDHRKKEVYPEQKVFAIDNGRIDTDNGCSDAVFSSENYLIDAASFQYKMNTYIFPPVEENNVFNRYFLSKKPHHFNETVLSLLSGGGISTMYFHWLYDVLPRIGLAKKSGLFDSIDKFLVLNPIQKFKIESLALLGIDESKVIDSLQYKHITADQLIVTTHPRNTRQCPKWIISFLQESFLRNNHVEKKDYEKIYISRQNTTWRKVIGEDELIDKLKNRGFREVILEKFPFEEQAAIMNSAKLIISPHGAGLANLVFCDPGTKVFEIFSKSYVIPGYAYLSKSLDLNYRYFIDNTEFRELKRMDAQSLNILPDIKQLLNEIDKFC